MKKLLLTFVLGAIACQVLAQGTIRFGNNTLTWVGVRLLDGTERFATAQDNLLIGAFYGPLGTPADSLVLAPGLATIGSVDGVMFNAPDVFPLPGTVPRQEISLQIRAWSATLGPNGWEEARLNCAGGYYGETDVRSTTLGPTTGPGATIWGGRGFNGNPNWFTPLTASICPEPSTLVLGALGGLGWLIFLRRRK